MGSSKRGQLRIQVTPVHVDCDDRGRRRINRQSGVDVREFAAEILDLDVHVDFS